MIPVRRIREVWDNFTGVLDHTHLCEYRTAAKGWAPGAPPVIKCACGLDELEATFTSLPVSGVLLDAAEVAQLRGAFIELLGSYGALVGRTDVTYRQVMGWDGPVCARRALTLLAGANEKGAT